MSGHDHAMTVSNEDIWAWVQQAKAEDRPGVRMVFDGLDLEEAREVARRLFSFLTALVALQDHRVAQMNEDIMPILRTLTAEEQVEALGRWIEAVPLGSIGLRDVMHGWPSGEPSPAPNSDVT